MNTAATHPDPFQALGEALQAVIEDAVAKALASVKTASSEDAVMLSVPEAAERLGVGTTKVKQLIASGQLASVTIGRRRLVPAENVRSFGSGDAGRGLAS
ncbi:MAG: helix-turn-helix domain-containing protein [Actinomycetota bacterium]|nr:helix-turn-helix domain-containing protein [Actinomycetota bacterium]